ncbi:2-oxoglutarate oxidoreductase [Myxococcota bacterium]|nr:2-oxoglutarate oxidoreductase [Myxococcota bacterium]MBU1381260.1 2-oxoglutarate oxidoreductase [Myxococcota bacterium]MBU1499214.1 2-oxoglutarate oxidoreductase [Myxococcota bacterium]
MKTIFTRPDSMTEKVTHYCPGCTHGVAHRMVAEIIDEFGIKDRTLGFAPVGCSVLIYEYMDTDYQQAAHGRAPACATGAKRVRPELIVYTYQGDGDLASIGTAEIIHAANRGEKFTVVFINNAIYGMTGGQMAPTTMPGQRTTTSPMGRDVLSAGHPIRMSEMLSTLRTPAYVVRASLHTPYNIIQSKKALRQAFQYQMDNRCFSFVELLSTCPTNWGITPVGSNKWLEENMLPYYPLGVFKTPDDE